jgi:hypothetical protein
MPICRSPVYGRERLMDLSADLVTLPFGDRGYTHEDKPFNVGCSNNSESDNHG